MILGGTVPLALCLLALAAAGRAVGDPERLARDYAAAIEAVNRAHAEKPVVTDERELAKKLPAAAAKLVAQLVAEEDSPATRDALELAARTALDLDLVQDFETLRTRLAALDPERAAKLGIVLSRPRFLAFGTNGVEAAGLEAVADVFDLVLDGYADVFGLVDFSKVPGKKLRLHVHLEAKITRPPHFEPQFPFHSQIDFPVVDARAFKSPTADGKFLLYGLCHELGHVIAMWGDRKNEEDRHAWAHYTGVVLVEHLSEAHKDKVRDLKDERWRSLSFERKQLEAKKVKPGPLDPDTVFARFLALHDAVGPKVIGEALNDLDAADKHLLVNRVRYYAMRDFEAALLATKAGKAKRKAVEAAFAN